MPRVDVGAAVGAHVAKTAADVFSSISQADKAKQKAATDKASGGSNVNNQTVNVYGSGSGSGGESRKSSIDIPEIGDTDITPDPYVRQFKSSPKTGYDKNEKRTVTGQKTLFSSFKDGGDEARLWIAENPDLYKQMLKDKSKNQQRTNTFDANDQKISSTEWQDMKGNTTAMNMKGSPNKLIGDTMDPYGQINPGAVPPNQAQNDLGAQPIIGAQGSQPSARAIDMAAIENPYATPGADFNPQSKMKAESIFGSPMQRQGLMNLGTPLHDKGHANDYEGHTHRKKGGSYKEGDYMDETDMETSYPKLYTQDVGEIKRDKKSQFMVSKNEDYSPTKIDTIRPLKGKEFKMGWGDAERNISTNPKYKKSK